MNNRNAATVGFERSLRAAKMDVENGGFEGSNLGGMGCYYIEVCFWGMFSEI